MLLYNLSLIYVWLHYLTYLWGCDIHANESGLIGSNRGGISWTWFFKFFYVILLHMKRYSQPRYFHNVTYTWVNRIHTEKNLGKSLISLIGLGKLVPHKNKSKREIYFASEMLLVLWNIYSPEESHPPL